jgi:hypothetical protein
MAFGDFNMQVHRRRQDRMNQTDMTVQIATP